MAGASAGSGSAAPGGVVGRLAVVAVAAAVALAGLAPAADAQDTDAPDTDAQETGAEDTGSLDGFSDVPEGVHKPGIDALNALGVFDGTECVPEMFCPGEEMKRWSMAVWLVRVLDEQDPPAVDQSSFADVDSDEWWLAYMERLAELEVTKGCKTEPLRFCPDRAVSRAQMATFLVRAFGLEAADPGGFTDTEGNTHEDNIDALAAAGVTAGCKAEPLRYCPTRSVTRAQMATFLARALGLVDIPTPAEDTSDDTTDDTSDDIAEDTSDEPELPPTAFTTVSAGGYHACGLRANGTVICWGDNHFKQIFAPEGLYSAVSAGNFHTCGLRTDGTVECWGANITADGDPAGQSDAPEGAFSAVSAGGEHSCGVRTDGAVECWGNNTGGQSRSPRGTFSVVDAGSWHSCGLRTSGTIACWGLDGSGQANAPGGGFSAVSAGWGHSCGVRTDGTVDCWGWNEDGQTDAPGGTFSAVRAGNSHSCGLRTDGTVECWGANTDFEGGYAGQADAPGGTFSTVSAGIWHSCGLRSDGSVECWGNNDLGQSEGPGAYSEITLGPSVCRPYGAPDATAGFPLPRWAAPSIGTMRVGVLFVDFADAEATHSTQEEAALGLPYAEAYLEAASYGRIDVEFVPLHGWLRAENNHDHYLMEGVLGHSRIIADSEAVRLADPVLDFTGHHAVMTVLPSSLFEAGNNSSGGVRTDEGAIGSMAWVNNAPRSEPGEPTGWGNTAAHELAHSLGLLDLYPYDFTRHERPEASEARTWVVSYFGLMDLTAAFLARPEDRRLEVDWLLPEGVRATGPTLLLDAREMLAWSRWQLGWLDESQVRCISIPEARVTLGPVADPGNAAAMAAVPLSDTEMLVIESRRKVGYDAQQEYSAPDGAHATIPALATEGVLVYIVDASIGSGELPAKVAGDGGNGRVDDYPILTRGQRVVVRGYAITVESDDGDTHTVTIFKSRS